MTNGSTLQESIGRGQTWTAWNFSVRIGRSHFDESAFEDLGNIREGRYKNVDAAIDTLCAAFKIRPGTNEVDAGKTLGIFREKALALIGLDSQDEYGMTEGATYDIKMRPLRRA